MTRIKMHISNVKLPFDPPCEVKCGLQNRVSTASGPLLARKIIRASFYWLTMESDCIKHVRTSHHCQVYQNRKNVPPQPLHSLVAP